MSLKDKFSSLKKYIKDFYIDPIINIKTIIVFIILAVLAFFAGYYTGAYLL